MKTLLPLSLLLFILASCQKEAKVTPKTAPVSTTTTTTTVVAAVKPDTIPDQAALKIKLVKDTDNYDETMFMFNHTSSLAFSNAEDARYFPGFGEESLASLSTEGQDLVINSLPYTSGMSVKLDANMKNGGAFVLKISYIRNIPSNIEILLEDAYLKNSVDLRAGNCNFTVDKAKPASFGSGRFKVVFKDKGQQ